MNDTRVNVLLIEDNPGDARLIQEMLAEAPAPALPFNLEWVKRLSAGLERLPQGGIDVVLSDLGLPDSQGLETFSRVQALAPDLPIVVLSGFDDEAMAVEAVQEGAQDYLVKGTVDGPLLARAVRYALERKRAEEAMRESEEKYRLLFENMINGFALHEIVLNEQGHPIDYVFLEVNSAFEQLTGLKRENVTGRRATEVLTDIEDDPAGWIERYGRVALTNQDLRFDAYSQPLDKWFSVTAFSPRKDQFATIFEDITAAKQREAELEAIAQVSAALRTAESRSEMLPVLLDQLLDLLNAEGAALAMRDPSSGEAVCELGRGGWADWTGVRLPAEEGVSGKVLSTGQPYLNNDVRNDSTFARPDLIADLRAIACVPLIAQQQTIGVLWAGRQDDIGQAEVHLLTAVADIAANAFHRATLHEQTQTRMKRLAALRDIDLAITSSLDLSVTLNILLDHVTTQLDVDAADVLLFSQHTQSLEYATGRGLRSSALQKARLRLGEGYAGRAALERRIVDVSNLAEAEDSSRRLPLLAKEGFTTYYGAPLIAKGQVKGVLEIFNRAPLTPDQEWIAFLETLAGQTAIAIDNAQLFDGLQHSNVELSLAYDTTLEGWARALELRDQETEGHTQRVTDMTLRLARLMGIAESELVYVRRGALLHDIGKMGIPDSILLKPGPLTEEEWDIMHQHPVYAYQMLSPIAYLKRSLDIPYCHHEKWDGTGYPRGLKGEQIPLAARVFAVVDVWDALLSDRPYRFAWPEEKALAHIREQAGEHFDPRVVEVFLELLMEEQAENESR